MDKWLMHEIRKITAEEQAYLDGDVRVKRDIYTLAGEARTQKRRRHAGREP